jgi:hypothetical protein
MHKFVVVALAFSLGAYPAAASQIVFTFAGTINYSTDASSSISELGSPFSGTLSYNSNDPVFTSSPSGSIPMVTIYSFGSSDSIILTVGGFTYSASGVGVGTPNQLEVIAGAGYEVFSATAWGSNISTAVPGFTPYSLSFELAGPPGLLTSPGLPTSFDLTDVVTPGYDGVTTGASVDSSPVYDAFEGTDFSSLEVQPTPEAATRVSVAFGLLVFLLLRKLRRKSSIGTFLA